jgi:hypothetical protein
MVVVVGGESSYQSTLRGGLATKLSKMINVMQALIRGTMRIAETHETMVSEDLRIVAEFSACHAV